MSPLEWSFGLILKHVESIENEQELERMRVLESGD